MADVFVTSTCLIAAPLVACLEACLDHHPSHMATRTPLRQASIHQPWVAVRPPLQWTPQPQTFQASSRQQQPQHPPAAPTPPVVKSSTPASAVMAAPAAHQAAAQRTAPRQMVRQGLMTGFETPTATFQSPVLLRFTHPTLFAVVVALQTVLLADCITCWKFVGVMHASSHGWLQATYLQWPSWLKTHVTP